MCLPALGTRHRLLKHLQLFWTDCQRHYFWEHYNLFSFSLILLRRYLLCRYRHLIFSLFAQSHRVKPDESFCEVWLFCSKLWFCLGMFGHSYLEDLLRDRGWLKKNYRIPTKTFFWALNSSHVNLFFFFNNIFAGGWRRGPLKVGAAAVAVSRGL